jgi:diadenosine tetraphosphatase ApaH/serine/threonine PP2A family protein phosphatase
MCGTVGQPRNGDPRAAYVVYDPGERYIEFRRVAYDVRKGQAKILKAGLPDLLAERLDTGN